MPYLLLALHITGQMLNFVPVFGQAASELAQFGQTVGNKSLAAATNNLDVLYKTYVPETEISYVEGFLKGLQVSLEPVGKQVDEYDSDVSPMI